MRTSSASHLTAFRNAFVAWRWPRSPEPAASPLLVAHALERWLAEHPEDAETIQRLALGAVQSCFLADDWEATGRMAQAGLDAALLCAPATDEEFASASLLALFAAHAAFERNHAIESRTLLERARDTLERVDPYGPLAPYLQLIATCCPAVWRKPHWRTPRPRGAIGMPSKSRAR